MDMNRAAEIMLIEKTCVLRQDTADCCRDECGCQCCDLIQETEDVLEAYDAVLKALKIQEFLRRSGVTVCTQDKELLNVVEWAERTVR